MAGAHAIATDQLPPQEDRSGPFRVIDLRPAPAHTSGSSISVPLLTLDNLSLTFGHLPLFENASLQIEAGERIALIGRNGSGKSSLLKASSGDVPMDGGVAVTFRGGEVVSRQD